MEGERSESMKQRLQQRTNPSHKQGDAQPFITLYPQFCKQYLEQYNLTARKTGQNTQYMNLNPQSYRLKLFETVISGKKKVGSGFVAQAAAGSACLPYWSAPLPAQLSVAASWGAADSSSGSWAPAALVGDPVGVAGSGLRRPQPWLVSVFKERNGGW